VDPSLAGASVSTCGLGSSSSALTGERRSAPTSPAVDEKEFELLFPQSKSPQPSAVVRGFVMTIFAILVLSGCGGGAEDAAPERSTGDLLAQDPGPVHVHGLG
jgi:hypothetical protein